MIPEDIKYLGRGLSYFMPGGLLYNGYEASKEMGFSNKQPIFISGGMEAARDGLTYLICGEPLISKGSMVVSALLTMVILKGFIHYGFREEEFMIEPKPEAPLDSKIKDIIK